MAGSSTRPLGCLRKGVATLLRKQHGNTMVDILFVWSQLNLNSNFVWINLDGKLLSFPRFCGYRKFRRPPVKNVARRKKSLSWDHSELEESDEFSFRLSCWQSHNNVLAGKNVIENVGKQLFILCFESFGRDTHNLRHPTWVDMDYFFSNIVWISFVLKGSKHFRIGWTRPG
jgi:hypothetical protein